MDYGRKGFALILILLVAMSSSTLPMVNPANAQSVTKPSIPEFNVKYIDRSYDTQPTYGVDQYTGKIVITKPSEHVDNRTVEITIKNERFIPFNNSNGNQINRFYDVRYKGSYSETWTTMFANQTQVAGIEAPNPYTEFGYAIQDYSSQYTTIIYRLPSEVTNGQMDFQVESLEGYSIETSYDAHFYYVYYGFTFYGQESDWSKTQTISIGETSASTSPNPTPIPSIPEFSWLTILPLPLFIPIVLIMIRKRVHSRNSNTP
jgi:hypothetical protein